MLQAFSWWAAKEVAGEETALLLGGVPSKARPSTAPPIPQRSRSSRSGSRVRSVKIRRCATNLQPKAKGARCLFGQLSGEAKTSGEATTACVKHEVCTEVGPPTTGTGLPSNKAPAGHRSNGEELDAAGVVLEMGTSPTAHPSGKPHTVKTAKPVAPPHSPAKDAGHIIAPASAAGVNAFNAGAAQPSPQQGSDASSGATPKTTKTASLAAAVAVEPALNGSCRRTPSRRKAPRTPMRCVVSVIQDLDTDA